MCIMSCDMVLAICILYAVRTEERGASLDPHASRSWKKRKHGVVRLDDSTSNKGDWDFWDHHCSAMWIFFGGWKMLNEQKIEHEPLGR